MSVEGQPADAGRAHLTYPRPLSPGERLVRFLTLALIALVAAQGRAFALDTSPDRRTWRGRSGRRRWRWTGAGRGCGRCRWRTGAGGSGRTWSGPIAAFLRRLIAVEDGAVLAASRGGPPGRRPGRRLGGRVTAGRVSGRVDAHPCRRRGCWSPGRAPSAPSWSRWSRRRAARGAALQARDAGPLPDAGALWRQPGGVRAASLFWFGHEPESLTDGRAGPADRPAPVARGPAAGPASRKRRAARRDVLDQLVRAGLITEPQPPEADGRAPCPAARLSRPWPGMWPANSPAPRRSPRPRSTPPSTPALQARLEPLAAAVAAGRDRRRPPRCWSSRSRAARCGRRWASAGLDRPRRLDRHDAGRALARARP